MPNMIFHTVWNISPTVVLGDGLLYETSFDEWIGSGFPDRDFVRSRILLKAKGYTKVWLDDMINQIDEAIENYKIVDYARPKIDAYWIKRMLNIPTYNLVKINFAQYKYTGRFFSFLFYC